MSAHDQQRASVADIASAIRFISADDRDIWLRVGMAIKDELGDDGFLMWNLWSKSSASYNEKDAAHVWQSIKQGAVGIGSLFHYANANGWRRGTHSEPSSPMPTAKAAPSKIKPSTALYAAQLWLAAQFGDVNVGSHPYSQRKGITWAAGAKRGYAGGCVIGRNADCVIVPIRNIETNKLQAVQCINERGKKQTFGALKGCGLILGNTLDKSRPWYVTEGWASAVSMVFHHQHGNGICAASFGKHRLDEVAQRLADIHDPDEIIILREVD